MNQEKMTIKEIELLLQGDIAEEQIEHWRGDGRPAVERLIRCWEREMRERQRIAALYRYEATYYRQGLPLVAGIDEAGRGPLAGPVAVAAVILPPNFYLPKLNDSKKVSPKTREALYRVIMESAVAKACVFIEPEEIDRVNIYQATVEGMYTVLQRLNPSPQAVLIDAVPLDRLTLPHASIVRGDAQSASIAAASIVAKVERDRKMTVWDGEYPQYGFARHKGYGTAEHLAAIRRYGPCPIHRRSFEPIKSWRK